MTRPNPSYGGGTELLFATYQVAVQLDEGLGRVVLRREKAVLSARTKGSDLISGNQLPGRPRWRGERQ